MDRHHFMGEDWLRMDKKLTRAEFLRGRFRQSAREEARPYLAPPGALPGSMFETLCDGCGNCIPECPSQIISLTGHRKARLEFHGRDGGCSFCGKCAEACPTGALDPVNARPWDMKADLDVTACLSLNGIVCRICGDVCELRAIKFRLMTGGRAYPDINSEICTGCGICVALCPVQAVSLEDIPVQGEPIKMKETTA